MLFLLETSPWYVILYVLLIWSLYYTPVIIDSIPFKLLIVWFSYRLDLSVTCLQFNLYE